MVPEFKLKQFTGPLDLLLSLIDDQKMDISEIALSEVTEQYLAHLESIEEAEPQELADFLVVATRLLYIKSKLLLPSLAGDEDDGAQLEDQLRLYRAFVEASKKLNKMWLDETHGYVRIEPPTKPTHIEMPANVHLDVLHSVMVHIITRLAPPKPLPQAYIDRAVSLKEKVETLRNLLKKARRVGFTELLEDANSRTEIIVSFLALLELVKQHTAVINQTDNFSNIFIERV